MTLCETCLLEILDRRFPVLGNPGDAFTGAPPDRTKSPEMNVLGIMPKPLTKLAPILDDLSERGFPLLERRLTFEAFQFDKVKVPAGTNKEIDLGHLPKHERDRRRVDAEQLRQNRVLSEQ